MKANQNATAAAVQNSQVKSDLGEIFAHVLRATGYVMGMPAGLLIAAIIVGQTPDFIANANLMSARYMAVAPLALLAVGGVWLFRRDEVQAGMDILSILAVAICVVAAMAYFLG